MQNNNEKLHLLSKDNVQHKVHCVIQYSYPIMVGVDAGDFHMLSKQLCNVCLASQSVPPRDGRRAERSLVDTGVGPWDLQERNVDQHRPRAVH